MASAVPPRGAMLNSLGPAWLGTFFHNILAGMLIVQVYIYYVAFPKDHWSMKGIVYLVFILEMTQTIIRAVDNFEGDVMRWGDKSFLPEQQLDWFSTPVITAVTSAIVQAYFGYRVYVFSKSWIISMFIWVPTLLQLATGVALGAISEPLPLNLLSKNPMFKKVLPIWTASSAFTDVLIAILLTYYLYTMKSGIRQTDKLITKIIRLTVETGTVTGTYLISFSSTDILFVPTSHLLYHDHGSLLCEAALVPHVRSFNYDALFLSHTFTALLMSLVKFILLARYFSLLTHILLGKLYANNLMVMFNRRIDFHADAGTTVHSMGTGKTPTATGQESRIQFAGGQSTADRTLGSFTTKRGDTEWELEPRGKESFV
ncbi:hypothetical protein DL96DRAFT_500187 [Flagelloscypha sp. PMI_526]|nr:hypothetical protein DL96DRAFT_500187 [Flagelloscypha sp. PMI_526]